MQDSFRFGVSLIHQTNLQLSEPDCKIKLTKVMDKGIGTLVSLSVWNKVFLMDEIEFLFKSGVVTLKIATEEMINVMYSDTLDDCDNADADDNFLNEQVANIPIPYNFRNLPDDLMHKFTNISKGNEIIADFSGVDLIEHLNLALDSVDQG